MKAAVSGKKNEAKMGHSQSEAHRGEEVEEVTLQ